MWKCGNVAIPILFMIKYPQNYYPRPKKQKLILRSIYEFYFSFPEGVTVWWAVGLWKLESLPTSVCTTSGSRFLPESFLHLCSSGHKHRQGHQGKIFLCPFTWCGWGMASPLDLQNGWYLFVPKCQAHPAGLGGFPSVLPTFPKGGNMSNKAMGFALIESHGGNWLVLCQLLHLHDSHSHWFY